MTAAFRADTGKYPLRVLLVEDDEDDYLCTRDLLRDMGEGRFALDWVVKFEDAVAAMARREHDVYLVDYRLGNHDGLELLNEASRNGAPVILLSGLDDRAVDLCAMQAGAVDYLVKGKIDAALLDRSIRYAIERKQMEKELRRQAEALREADHHKDEFIAMLAHELRNPLAPIHSAVQLIKTLNLSDPRLNLARDIIERQAGQIALLVEDLLDVSRIIHGKFKLNMERVELAQVVAQALETSRPNIEARKHELTVTLPTQPLHLDADFARLVQVLSNVLNNAAKYTPKGGRINLTSIREDREAVIRVRDTGIGIPVVMLDRVFEMFTQIDQHRNQSQGGLGIGLTLVKRLTEMHGGYVHVHSEGEGMGAEFVLRLPLADSEGLAPTWTPVDGEQVIAFRRRRILVVDDKLDAADSLSTILSLGGHEVCIAHDGSTVIERVKSFKPDLVLLDLEMPGIDGYKTAKLIRNLPGGNETLLVALMGRGQDEDRRRTREAGFDFHLVKPVEFENLRQILATGKAMPAETGVISADSSPTMLATGEVSGQHTTMFIQAGKNIDSTFLSDQSH